MLSSDEQTRKGWTDMTRVCSNTGHIPQNANQCRFQMFLKTNMFACINGHDKPLKHLELFSLLTKEEALKTAK